MKLKLLIFSIITAVVFTGCSSSTSGNQSVPNVPDVVEPATSVDNLQVPFGGEDEIADTADTTDVDVHIDVTEPEIESTLDEVDAEEEGETSSTATELTTEHETSDSETTTTTTTTTVETTPASSSTNTTTSTETSSTATSSATSSTATSSATSSTATSSATTSTATSSTTTSTTTNNYNQNINSYVDFYVVDMSGNPLSGVTTKFELNNSTGASVPSATTDSTGKTRTQLVMTDIGKSFADNITLTYNQAFKANITLLSTTNSNTNISYVEVSDYSVLTQLNTITFDAGSTFSIMNDQVITVIIMVDFNTSVSNTSSNSSTTSDDNETKINSTLTLSLQDDVFSYYNETWYNSNFNREVKVEVELLSTDRKDSKMVTIYDGNGSDSSATYTFNESDVDCLIGSIVKVTANHPFETEVEFDYEKWREDGSRALSATNGDGIYTVTLHDIIDEKVYYGKHFDLMIIMDNRGSGN